MTPLGWGIPVMGGAAGLSAGRPLDQALQWSMAAGALATTKHGAQEAMPDRETLLALIAR